MCVIIVLSAMKRFQFSPLLGLMCCNMLRLAGLLINAIFLLIHESFIGLITSYFPLVLYMSTGGSVRFSIQVTMAGEIVNLVGRLVEKVSVIVV